MTYLKSFDKRNCFGCSACAQICPVSAISMKPDNEGFMYPIVDDRCCVHCELCIQVCPASANEMFTKPLSAVAGFYKDSSIRNSSSSGGAFAAITAGAAENTVVFGAQWESRSSVCHAGVPAEEAYSVFHKSKYIQSNVKETYQETKKYLKQDVPVIFTGTPCQIAGLKHFLGKDYPHLLCVDLVCHGVPSGKVLETYLSTKDRKNDPATAIDFRYKSCKHDQWDSKCAQIRYRSGKRVVVDYDSSGFLRGFANGLFFRPSCGICPYAQSQRVSDLTIGDFWGIEKAIPSLNPHEGVSLIIVNTDKGKQYFQRISQYMECTAVDYCLAVNGNARLKEPDPGHKDRGLFFLKLDTMNFERLVQQSVPRVSAIRKLGHRVKMWIKRR